MSSCLSQLTNEKHCLHNKQNLIARDKGIFLIIEHLWLWILVCMHVITTNYVCRKI